MKEKKELMIMKKNIISLIVVLIVTIGLLVGCTTYPGSQDSYQHGNGAGSTALHVEETDISSGYGNSGNATVDSEARGNGNGGNGNGQQVGAGDGDCDPTETYESAVTSSTESGNGASTAIVTEGYGATGAIADEDLILGEMLTYAIQDEYLAHAEYVYIIDTFGSAKPFSNIIKAEEQHIDALVPLFTEYGIEAPGDTGSDYAVAVSSLTEAYQAGEKAEIDNIAMYDEFLKQDLPDDVRAVFESLRKASENHLAAFRNHL
jgi:hypothetical protein